MKGRRQPVTGLHLFASEKLVIDQASVCGSKIVRILCRLQQAFLCTKLNLTACKHRAHKSLCKQDRHPAFLVAITVRKA